MNNVIEMSSNPLTKKLVSQIFAYMKENLRTDESGDEISDIVLFDPDNHFGLNSTITITFRNKKS